MHHRQVVNVLLERQPVEDLVSKFFVQVLYVVIIYLVEFIGIALRLFEILTLFMFGDHLTVTPLFLQEFLQYLDLYLVHYLGHVKINDTDMLEMDALERLQETPELHLLRATAAGKDMQVVLEL